jgi:hypothetical protein
MTTRSPSKRRAAKAHAAKPIAASKALTFATFTPWKKVSIDGDEDSDGSDFDLITATNDSVDYDDLFGEEPEHAMVCASSVKVDGDLTLSGWQAKKDAQQTVYIIEGDLTVDGTLVFSQSDIRTTL